MQIRQQLGEYLDKSLPNHSEENLPKTRKRRAETSTGYLMKKTKIVNRLVQQRLRSAKLVSKFVL